MTFSVKSREGSIDWTHDLQVAVNVTAESGQLKENTQLLAFFELPDERVFMTFASYVVAS